MGLELRGASIAMKPAQEEMNLLLDFYKQGQKAEQPQHQNHLDSAALQLAAQWEAERQRQEAEENAAWIYAVQQMQQQYMAQQVALQQYWQQVHLQYGQPVVYGSGSAVVAPIAQQQQQQQMQHQ